MPPPPPDDVSMRPLTEDDESGMSAEAARKLARNFFLGGFLALPGLWLVNCALFGPALRRRQAGDAALRKYVIRSGVGFLAVTTLLLTWSLTFTIGGERVFGSKWKNLAVYNLMDKLQAVLEMANAA